MNYPDPPLNNLKRVTVLLLLERHEKLVFSDLARAMNVSKGSLDSQLATLEKHRLVQRSREFVHGSVHTVIYPTVEGINALQVARQTLLKLLDDKQD